MTLYVPLDVDFATDPKMLAAGPVAGYLYISSLALAKRTMSDGKIERPQLVAIAIGIPNPDRHAQRLVEVGLWEQIPDGWRIASWLKRNKSRKQIETEKLLKKEHAVKANHDRWHVHGKTSPSCPHCDRLTDPLTDPQSIENGVQVEEEAEAEPKEEAEADLGTVSLLVEAELAARLERRRRKGEDIGPTLERLIRVDVERDLTLFLGSPSSPAPLRRVYACEVCEDRRQVVNADDLDSPPMVPCPACSLGEGAA